MAEYSITEQQQIKDFIVSINDMIDGRFILSDIKVANVLKSIAVSELLYNLFSKCLTNFNYNREFKNAIVSNQVNGGYFVLPTEENKIIALVFCFLLEVDKAKINLQSFVTENFYSTEGYNFSYNNFSLNVLVPFKNSVLNMLGINENLEPVVGDQIGDNQISFEETVEAQRSDENTKIVFANLLLSINDLSVEIKKDNKLKQELKEEMILVLKAMREAIRLESFVIINALIVPLEFVLPKNKHLNPYYKDLKEYLMSYYYKK